MRQPRDAHRRLRRNATRTPQWALIVPPYVTRQQAEDIRRRWLQAGRQGVAVVSSGIEIRRLR